MADVLSHGGDGGGEPPHEGGSRIPGHCETAPSSRRRGLSYGLNLVKAFESNGKQPIPIDFDNKEKTYQPIGNNQKYVSRHVGNQVRNFVVPCYNKWDEVPAELKERVINSVHDFFNLQPTNYTEREYDIIIKGLERTAADRYRSYNNTVNTHFKKHGPSKPYRSMNAVDWENCVQLYIDPKFVERSEKNIVNRSKSKYPSLHGSKSFSAARYEMRDQQTQEWPNVIDSLETFHRRRKTREWVNDRAASDYDQMVEVRNTQTQEAASTGTPIDERNIVKQVFGKRRGHVRGVGRIVKGSSHTLSSTGRSRASPYSQSLAEIKAQLDSQNEYIRVMNEYMAHMTNSLQTYFPGIQLRSSPPPPPLSGIQLRPPPPSPPPSAPQPNMFDMHDDASDEDMPL